MKINPPNMEKKMTAVEWLIEKIENHPNSWENSSVRRMNISIDTSEYLDLKREALSMEREQKQKDFDLLLWHCILYLFQNQILVDYRKIKADSLHLAPTQDHQKYFYYRILFED